MEAQQFAMLRVAAEAGPESFRLMDTEEARKADSACPVCVGGGPQASVKQGSSHRGIRVMVLWGIQMSMRSKLELLSCDDSVRA